MKKKASRLDTIRMIISSREIGSQGELLQALLEEGFALTQATLSRDLRQLKVSKAANPAGRYVYVLPREPLYRYPDTQVTGGGKPANRGFVSLHFSGNIAVVHTRPGYASSMAYDIDNHECEAILGTIAGDDTIMLVLKEQVSHDEVRDFLSQIVPDIN